MAGPARVALARASIDAASLGSSRARQSADRLAKLVASDESIGFLEKTDLVLDFARLDSESAGRALVIAREFFDETVAKGEADGRSIEPLVNIAALVGSWYRSEGAFRLLFDAYLLDQRAPNMSPGHPLRRLGEIVHGFHPEVTRSGEERYALAKSCFNWLAEDPNPERVAVAAKVVCVALSPRLKASYTDPARPLTFQIYETIVRPNEMERISTEVLPRALAIIERSPAAIVNDLIEVVGDWLRIGGGYDHPFGQTHSPDSVAAAAKIAKVFVDQLAACPSLSLGSRLRLESMASFHGITVAVSVPTEYEPFFRDLERSDDWILLLQNLHADLQGVAARWLIEGPIKFSEHLRYLRDEIALSGTRGPDRIQIACKALAAIVPEPRLWFETCLQSGLIAEVSPFARRCMDESLLQAADVRLLLSVPQCRGQIIKDVFTAPKPPSWAIEIGLEALGPDDFRTFEALVASAQVTDDRVAFWLSRASGPAQMVVAVGWFIGRMGDGKWNPGTHETIWLSVIRTATEPLLRQFPRHDVDELADYLVVHHPTVIAEIIERCMDQIRCGASFQALPHEWQGKLALLPVSIKSEMWERFKDEPTVRWILRRDLVGLDLEFLAMLLDDGLITVEEAIDCFNGSGPTPPIRELATFLVPRGADPAKVAALRFSPGGWGSESGRYEQIAAEFSAALHDEDSGVRAVAAAGAAMFGEAATKAAITEKRQRVLGRL